MSEVIISINGLDIKKNTRYKVVDKPDNNALDGLREYGSTKVPMEGVYDTVQCPWDPITETYDTGLYLFSRCYNHLTETQKIQAVKTLEDNIVEPYEQVYGKGVLDNKNEDFWQNLDIKIEAGRIFNTSNVKDLLELYIAMRGFELTPKGELGNPKFRNSQYVVEDREITNKRNNERAQNYMEAMQVFFTTMTQEKHKLVPILKYANMNAAHTMNEATPDSTLNSLFKTWIDTDVKNVDNFLRIHKLTQKKQGLDEVSMYSIVLNLLKNNKLQKVGEEYTYEDTPLGADLKTVAKNLVTKKGLKEIKDKIAELEVQEDQ